MESLKVGLFQYSPVWEDPEQNMKKIFGLIEKHSYDEDLLIFPEMTLTGFTMESEKFAEEIDEQSFQFFMFLAKRLNKHIFAGIIENDKERFYNTLVHFDKKGLIAARYRKIHPFSYAKEDQHFLSAKEPVITKIDNIRIGLSICYDLRFPELYRNYGKEKVDMMVNIANWPIKRIKHWDLLLRARAIENQSFMIGVNRVGKDTQVQYTGSSAVLDPMGNDLIEQSDEEGILFADLDFELVNKTRNRYPFLEDIKLI